MFRNFVKPAAFEKASARDGNGEAEDVTPSASSKLNDKDPGGGQSQKLGADGRGSSHSITTMDAKMPPQKCQSQGSMNVQGGVYKTSVYVNGTIAKSQSAASLQPGRDDSCRQQQQPQQQHLHHHQQQQLQLLQHQQQQRQQQQQPQQWDNKKPEGTQLPRSAAPVNSLTQRAVTVQARSAANDEGDQPKHPNGLPSVQRRTSRSSFDDHRRLSHSQQRLSNGLIEAPAQMTGGSVSQQKGASQDPSDKQNRVYNESNSDHKRQNHINNADLNWQSVNSDHAQIRTPSHSANSQPRPSNDSSNSHPRLPNESSNIQPPRSGDHSIQTRLSSSASHGQLRSSTDDTGQQKLPSVGHTNEQHRVHSSTRGEQPSLSAGRFPEQNQKYTNSNEEKGCLYTGPRSGQALCDTRSSDIKSQASSAIFSRELSHKSNQETRTVLGKSSPPPTSKLNSPEIRQLPLASNSIGSNHPGQVVEKTTIPAAHQPAEKVPELQQRGLYYQSQYHVVPPPPPLFESAFAGLRDIRNPSSIYEKQIVSVKGTVRGFKNRVRAGIATFWAQSEDKRNYRQLEQGKIVLYGTSMSVVRETSERCRSVRRLLHNHMVRYEERDLYMSREYQQELRQRLASEGIFTVHLPHVFADGIHMGGAGELEKLNEAGELRGLLSHYQKVVVRIMCNKCGGYRFLPCEFCHGSKKSLLRNHFTEEFCALRCMHCDDNGLRRCDLCADQQE